MKTKLYQTFFVLFLLALISNGCGHKEASKRLPVPVKITTVEEYKGSNEIRYSANIQPRQEVTLAFNLGGYVEKLFQVRDPDGHMRDVQEGDRVKRGTVLAQIRKSDYQAKLQQAQGAMAEAQAEVQRSGLDLERANNLFASQSMTKSDFDNAQARSDSAKAREEAYSAQVKAAQIALHDSDLKTPMDAIIVKRNVDAGDLAAPGSLAFILADTSSVKAIFGIPDLVFNRFQIGHKLSVITESIPGVEFQGIVTRISPAADSKTRLFETELTIPNPEDRIKAGMIATILLRPDNPSVTGTLVVPLTAIVQAKGKTDQYAVMTVQREGGKMIARQKDVTLGETFGDKIAVQQGVTSGEQVITTGATLVLDGEEVTLIP